MKRGRNVWVCICQAMINLFLVDEDSIHMHMHTEIQGISPWQVRWQLGWRKRNFDWRCLARHALEKSIDLCCYGRAMTCSDLARHLLDMRSSQSLAHILVCHVQFPEEGSSMFAACCAPPQRHPRQCISMTRRRKCLCHR